MSNVLPPTSPLILCSTLLNVLDASTVAMSTCAQSCTEIADKSTEYLQSHPDEVKNTLTYMAHLLEAGAKTSQEMVSEGRLSVASALPVPTGKRMA